MESPEDSGHMGHAIAPAPLELDSTALYAWSFAAFGIAALALSLGITYLACNLPLPVSLACHACTDESDGAGKVRMRG